MSECRIQYASWRFDVWPNCCIGASQSYLAGRIKIHNCRMPTILVSYRGYLGAVYVNTLDRLQCGEDTHPMR